SVSAYNKKWDDALSTNREKINVQIAIRSTDNKDTIVVGTPIITSEY
ncbi:YwmB family TATA-box binding protein, partial [Bacillus paranthracis]